MNNLTSFKVGGPARYFSIADSIDDLKDIRKFSQEVHLPLFYLGKGTNLLVSDKGFNGIVVKLGTNFSEIAQKDETKFSVGAATPLARFARRSINLGLSGIHKLAGIPGSLGGAIYMNAGAYGQEISQTCTEVESLCSDGSVRVRSAEECNFGYRHSIFQDLASSPETEEIILSATFQLSPAEVSGKTQHMLESEMQECMAKRRSSQPLSKPNAGSTFKRLDVGAESMPQQIAPGYYIEQSGLKGYRIGGAEVSTVHANFIVNAGGATACDIKELSEFVQKMVAKKFAVQLKREIILLGEF